MGFTASKTKKTLLESAALFLLVGFPLFTARMRLQIEWDINIRERKRGKVP